MATIYTYGSLSVTRGEVVVGQTSYATRNITSVSIRHVRGKMQSHPVALIFCALPAFAVFMLIAMAASGKPTDDRSSITGLMIGLACVSVVSGIFAWPKKTPDRHAIILMTTAGQVDAFACEDPRRAAEIHRAIRVALSEH